MISTLTITAGVVLMVEAMLYTERPRRLVEGAAIAAIGFGLHFGAGI